MISFIVPTMWVNARRLANIIDDYKRANIPNAEFILIDNSHGCYLEPEITVLIPKENLFVNKSWNIGVEIAKNNIVCLLNDDIEINFETIKNNLKRINDLDFGIIGFDANKNLGTKFNTNVDVFEFKEAECRYLGFGCMMFIRKENYLKIDERLRIFFGDDLLYWWNKDKNGRKIYIIDNLKALGELSATSKNYNDEIQLELPYFDEVIRNLQNG
jgi:GT2 family glycosyltransferase